MYVFYIQMIFSAQKLPCKLLYNGALRYIYPALEDDEMYRKNVAVFEEKFRKALELNIEELKKEKKTDKDIREYEADFLAILDQRKEHVLSESGR